MITALGRGGRGEGGVGRGDCEDGGATEGGGYCGGRPSARATSVRDRRATIVIARHLANALGSCMRPAGFGPPRTDRLLVDV